VRAQDQSAAGSQATLRQADNFANQDALNRDLDQRRQLQQGYTQQMVQTNDANANRYAQMDQLRGEQVMARNDAQYRAGEAATERGIGMISGLAQGGASILSDERKKKAMKEAGLPDLDEMFGLVKKPNMSVATLSPLQREISGLGAQQSLASDEPFYQGEDEGEGEGFWDRVQSGLKSNKKSDGKSKSFEAGENVARLGGALAALSDKNEKKQIDVPSEEKLSKFIDALKAYEYEYKNPDEPGAGEGRYISPMAQDMEKSEIGSQMVEDTPDGKIVNYGKAGGVMLATAAMLNDRMGELEQAFAGMSKRKKS
jgi:hypothetical protein